MYFTSIQFISYWMDRMCCILEDAVWKRIIWKRPTARLLETESKLTNPYDVAVAVRRLRHHHWSRHRRFAGIHLRRLLAAR